MKLLAARDSSYSRATGSPQPESSSRVPNQEMGSSSYAPRTILPMTGSPICVVGTGLYSCVRLPSSYHWASRDLDLNGKNSTSLLTWFVSSRELR